MGTAGYMSPEQVPGQRTDHRTDIFALGAILNEDPPGISQVTENIPLALQRVVHRCLEKNPKQRFQSASDLAEFCEYLS